MQKNEYDIIIVGGGVIGASILHKIISDNRAIKVLLIEKNRFGCGSTGYSGGIVRVFNRDNEISEMSFEGYKYYTNFKKYTGIEVPFTKCGFLYFIENVDNSVTYMVAGLQKKININWVKADQNNFSYINWSGLSGAVYEPDAGYINPKLVTNAWIESAQELGGQAFEGVDFQKLLTQDGKVYGMETNCGNFYAKKVIMCCGAWTSQLDIKFHAQLEQVYAKRIQLNSFQTDCFIEKNEVHPAYIDESSGIYGRSNGMKFIYLGSPVERININPNILFVTETWTNVS